MSFSEGKSMGDLPQPPLPHIVEKTIESICAKKNQSPPSPAVRQMLAAAGEEVALDVVRRIHNSPGPVRNLDSLISYRLEYYSPSPNQDSSPLSPQQQSSPSHCHSPLNRFFPYSASPAAPASSSPPSFAAAVPPATCNYPFPAAAAGPSTPYSSAAYSSPLNAAPPSSSAPGPPDAYSLPFSAAAATPPPPPSAACSSPFSTAAHASAYSSPLPAAAPSSAYSSPLHAAAPSVAYSSPFSAASSAPSAAYSSPFSAAACANASPSSAAIRPSPFCPAASFNEGQSSYSRGRHHRNFPSSNFGRANSNDVNRWLFFDEDSFGERTNCDRTDYLLLVLNQLEFRKFFLLLCYIGRHKLEEVVSPADAHSIAGLKDIPMAEFESRIWSNYGNRFLKAEDRRQCSDWECGKTHLYYCEVYQDGNFLFKGPCLTTTRTHLQRSLGDDNVLIVKFMEEDIGYANIVSKEGILVGLRRYHFFVFKDESRDVKKKDRKQNGTEPTFRNVKCYFVHLDSISRSGGDEVCPFPSPNIAKARCIFMHIHKVPTMAKYMARFSLILSKTIKLPVDLSSVAIETIEDIPFRDENGCIVLGEDDKPLIHTDGTGFISEDLAVLCPDFGIAKYIKENVFQKFRGVIEFMDVPSESSGPEAWNREPPLLMQCRLFRKGLAVKGTLLLNRKLRQTIQIRPSMVKVERDEDPRTQPVPQTFDSLEIVAVSHRPRRNYLSKNLIALLSYGGVPRNFFLDLLKRALDDTLLVYTDKRAAIKVAILHGELDDNYTAAKMISAGIPLDEANLQDRLSKLANIERKQLKDGKLPISESFYLMGTADPTGSLNSNEVCVILENGQISGRVLVYRNPGLHFGDIHVMEAVYVKDLENIIGNAKYGIFFSTKGRRSAAAEMGNGDFDGDMYWISRNPSLLGYFRPSEPWSRIYSTPHSVSRKPSDYSPEELEPELFRQFLQARIPSLSMALAADSWLSFMDQLLMLEGNCCTEKENLKRKVLKLIDIYYDALDAPKSGKKVNVPPHMRAVKFPHYMGKGEIQSYQSSSVLGEMYDRVQQFESAERQSGRGIWKLPFFIRCIETRSLEPFVNLWKRRYADYRKEMTNALKAGSKDSRNAAANEVTRKYKLMLYEAEDFYDSRKDSTQIYNEALAIYHLTYDYAISVNEPSRCSFAWKVAGPALCKLLAFNQNEIPLLILPSILKETL